MQSLLENKLAGILIVLAILGVILIPAPENYEGITGEFNPTSIPVAFGLLAILILLDLLYDKITYIYLEDDVRVHKKTGQKQMHIDVLVNPGQRAKGWVNMKMDEEEKESV